MKSLWAAAFALVGVATTSIPGYTAAPLKVSVKQSVTGGLKAQTLYEVHLNCKKGPKELPTNVGEFDNSVANPFAHWAQTASHYVVIGNALPGIDPSKPGEVTLPAASNTINVFPIFSMKFDHVVDYRTACSGDVYVTGGEKIYLIPIASWSSQVTPGPILTAVNAFAQLISPLWSIFAPFPANIGSKLTDAQQTQTAIGGILDLLKKDENYATAYSLGVGTHTITTDFSEIDITVSPVTSLFRSKSGLGDLIRELNKQPTTKFTGTNDCTPMAGQLLERGLSGTQDVPFALAYIGKKSFHTKQDMLTCLDAYAVAAAQLGSSLWSHVPATLVFTLEEAKNFSPAQHSVVQPDFSKISRLLDDFVLALSRAALSSPPPSDVLHEIQTDTTAKVVINDRTVGKTFGAITAPVAPADLIVALTEQGYHQFGCNGAMKPEYGNNPSGAVAVFVAFKVPANVTTATMNQALVVSPIFENGLISTIYVASPLAEVQAILKDNNWACGEHLQISHP